MSWLKFHRPTQAPGQKTLRWTVTTADGSGPLGEIAWFGRWRKYAFFVEPHSVFEQECLREIAAFCEDRTREHKEKARG